MMEKKSFEWWVGQAIAIYLGIATLGAYNGTAAAVVAYVIFVLVDIREYSKPNGHNVKVRRLPPHATEKE